MLWSVGSVCRRTAALMDDAAAVEFDRDYLLPFMNQNWDDLVVELDLIGLDYSEEIAVLHDVPAQTENLDSYMSEGQPLASLMLPRWIDWKPQGAPDIEYESVRLVEKLNDYTKGVEGVPEYAWSGSSILLGGPPSQQVDLRIGFDAMAVELQDPTQKTIRGVTHIIAARTAALVWLIRGNTELAEALDEKATESLDHFERAAVMRNQAKTRRAPPMHPKFFSGGRFILPNNNN